MAEPSVGMKFGTYNTLVAQNEKYYTKFKSYIRETSFGNHHIVETTEVWANPINIKQKITGCKNVDIKSSESPYNSGQLEVIYEMSPNEFVTLKHYGNKNLGDGDIIFNRILGEKTYAKDNNGNGIVDDNEIYSIDTLG